MSSSQSQSWCSDRLRCPSTRAAVTAPAGGVWRAALAFFRRGAALLTGLLALLPAGCREEAVGPAEKVTPRVAFPPDALYRFTTWELDEYGAKLPGSDRQRRWVVLSTNVESLGYPDVTLVADSGEHGLATLAFRCTPEGDIYLYGYLAGLVQRLEGRTIEPRWDRIVAYSQGWAASWTVGGLDSTGTELMLGSNRDEELYFRASVNGVPTIVAGYPVVLSSRLMETVLWISEKPPGFVRVREERFPSLPRKPGTLQEVTVINVPRTAAR